MGGFSVEAILGSVGGTPTPLLEAIKGGKIRGAVGMVGCNNPKIKHDSAHVTLIRRLIENDILVVDTGCVSVATAKAGYKVPSAIEMAGPGIKEVCGALGIPPVLHMGELRGQCPDPRAPLRPGRRPRRRHQRSSVAGSAPEWYSEKAVTDRHLARACLAIYPFVPTSFKAPEATFKERKSMIMQPGTRNGSGSSLGLGPGTRASAFSSFSRTISLDTGNTH
jgi:hypothetical protein